MFLRDCAGADITEFTIICFSNYRVQGANLFIAFLIEGIRDYSFNTLSHGKGIGKDDRRLYITQFLNLADTRHLTKAVSHENSCRTLPSEEISFMRNDRRYTSMDFFSFIDGNMSYPHAGNIGNRIIFTGLKYSRANTVIPQTTFRKTVQTD